MRRSAPREDDNSREKVQNVRGDSSAARRGADNPPGKEQLQSIRAAQVQIVANDRFEEMASLHRTVEDLCQTYFELTDREPMVVAGAARSSMAIGHGR